jgi:hypothetical protein
MSALYSIDASSAGNFNEDTLNMVIQCLANAKSDEEQTQQNVTNAPAQVDDIVQIDSPAPWGDSLDYCKSVVSGLINDLNGLNDSQSSMISDLQSSVEHINDMVSQYANPGSLTCDHYVADSILNTATYKAIQADEQAAQQFANDNSAAIQNGDSQLPGWGEGLDTLAWNNVTGAVAIVASPIDTGINNIAENAEEGSELPENPIESFVTPIASLILGTHDLLEYRNLYIEKGMNFALKNGPALTAITSATTSVLVFIGTEGVDEAQRDFSETEEINQSALGRDADDQYDPSQASGGGIY